MSRNKIKGTINIMEGATYKTAVRNEYEVDTGQSRSETRWGGIIGF